MDNETKYVRCNYGPFDLFDNTFMPKSDLHAHLQSDHGFDAEGILELYTRINHL